LKVAVIEVLARGKLRFRIRSGQEKEKQQGRQLPAADYFSAM